MQKSLIQLPVSLIKYQPPMPVTSKQALQNIRSDHVHQGRADIRDLLNVLLPPRTFNIQKKQPQKSMTYVQYAQGDKLKREDVNLLKQKIQGFLIVRKARDKPICPIRQKIFAQALEQIIRQVLIDSAQRGVMLSRVKNQLFLTVTAYRTLYEQSLKLSMSKISIQENDLSLLEQEERQLLQRRRQLQEKQTYLYSKKQSLEQKARQVKTIYKEKREHQLGELRLQQQGLVRFLTQMGRMPGMGEDRNEGEENVDVGKNNNNDSDDND